MGDGIDKQRSEESTLEFDGFHVRRYFLTGTVGFPTPFPTLGEIRRSKLIPPEAGATWTGTPWCDEKAKDAVIVHQPADSQHKIYRVVLLDDVQAIFIPKDRDKETGDDDQPCAPIDLEKGDWIVKPDGQRELPSLGIVFVKETAPVFRRTESVESAVESAERPLLADYRMGCSCT